MGQSISMALKIALVVSGMNDTEGAIKGNLIPRRSLNIHVPPGAVDKNEF
jgi:hypothetical protein